MSSNALLPAAAKSDARRAASFEGSNENDIPKGNMVHNMKRRDDIGVKDLMLKDNVYASPLLQHLRMDDADDSLMTHIRDSFSWRSIRLKLFRSPESQNPNLGQCVSQSDSPDKSE
jgi:hypothetical protein